MKMKVKQSKQFTACKYENVLKWLYGRREVVQWFTGTKEEKEKYVLKYYVIT